MAVAGSKNIRGRKLRGITDKQENNEDVTDRYHVELEYRSLEVRFVRAFESAPFGMSLVSVRTESLGRYIQANQAYCAMVGYPQEELLTMAQSSVVHPDDTENYDRVVHELGAGRAIAVECELRMLRRDRSVIWVRQRRSLVRDDSGRPSYIFSHCEDVTQRKARQAALAEAAQRLYHCFENAPMGTVLVSVDPADVGRYLEANRAACRITGYSREKLLQMHSNELTHPDERVEDARVLQRLATGELESYDGEKRFIRPDGSVAWCLLQRSLVRDANGGKPLYCITQIVDVTARKRAEERLRHLADHDTLTELLNRRGFERTLERHLAEVQRYRQRSALLLIDLDQFKYVNDTLGHAAGDELLREISSALGRRCRSSDILARLGGDEFTVILPEADAATAQSIAGDLCRVIREEARLRAAPQMHVTASIGVLTLDAAMRLTTQEALAAADIAMYQAKDAGGDRVRLAAATTNSQATCRPDRRARKAGQ